MVGRFLLLAALALPVAACAWDSGAQLAAPRPGAPCGAGVACYEPDAAGALAATGTCCWQGSVCGGAFPNVGCPAGQCCQEGDYGAAPGAAHLPHVIGHQWSATR